jgi:hypothetical protein
MAFNKRSPSTNPFELNQGSSVLFRRPQAGRSQPLAYVRAGFGLPHPAEGSLAYRSAREQFCFFAEAPHFFGKAFFKGYGLLEAVSLHGAAPFLEKAGALVAFSSPMKAKGRAVMPGVCHVRYRTHGQFCSPLKS